MLLAKQKQLYLFCDSYNETINHIFLEYLCAKQLWNNLRFFLTNDICLPVLMPQTVIFISEITNNVYKITNHILLIFKLQVYESKERSVLELSRLINKMKKVKLLEKNSAQNYVRKPEKENIMWEKT